MADQVTKKDIDAINKRINEVIKSLGDVEKWAENEVIAIRKELIETDKAVNQHAKLINDLQKK